MHELPKATSKQTALPDLDKYYRKFPEYSKFSLTFHKNGLFSMFTKFSRLSMNPDTKKFDALDQGSVNYINQGGKIEL